MFAFRIRSVKAPVQKPVYGPPRQHGMDLSPTDTGPRHVVGPEASTPRKGGDLMKPDPRVTNPHRWLIFGASAMTAFLLSMLFRMANLLGRN